MVHEINYDLRRPGQDDEGLYAAIKNCGDWWHFLDFPVAGRHDVAIGTTAAP